MKTKIKTQKVPLETIQLVGQGHIPSETLKKYLKWRNYVKSANKIFADFEKNKENVDAQRDEAKAYVQVDSNRAELLEIEPSLVNDEVTLNCYQKIVYWRHKLKEAGIGVKGSAVFDGTFENQCVSVKRTPRAMSYAAINEAKLLLKMIHHENIIRYLCICEDSQFHYVITDDYQMALESFVKSDLMKLPTKLILKQLCSAVEFLQQMKVVSLSLNPTSVRVATSNGLYRIKLTSFDFSAEIKNGEKVVIGNDFKGMKGFIAPEVKTKKKANLSSDIYSLGCLFYYILTGGDSLPQVYSQHQGSALGKMQKFQEKNKTCDGVLSALMMKKMLSVSSKKRPTIDVIISQPYFWNTHEIFDLILQITKKSEDDSLRVQLKEKIEVNKVHVIGADWKQRIDEDVVREISKKRSYNGSQLFDLVKAIRNQFAHRTCSAKLATFIGTTNDELKDYWLGKFPQLIPHLCRITKLLT